MTNAIMCYMTKCHQPLSTVDQAAFRHMVKTMCPSYTLLHETQFTLQLRDKYEVMKGLVRNKLKEAKHLYLTTDIWSDIKMRGYLGLTCHYLQGKFYIETLF